MHQVLDHCPGCNKCTMPGVCPTNAIKIENGKAAIGQGCIDCGLCIPICPIGVIVKAKEPVEKTADPSTTTEEEEAERTEGDQNAASTTSGA